MMKNLKTVTCGLLISIQLAYSSFAVSATGTIVLRDKNNTICNLPAPTPGNTITYPLGGTNPKPCGNWNDRARSFQISEMPSATTILFANDAECKTELHLGPWFYLKTTNKVTTMKEIMEFQYLATYQPKQIIMPGLQMLTMRVAENNFEQLSCVRITTSPVPPAPAPAP